MLKLLPRLKRKNRRKLKKLKRRNSTMRKKLRKRSKSRPKKSKKRKSTMPKRLKRRGNTMPSTVVVPLLLQLLPLKLLPLLLLPLKLLPQQLHLLQLQPLQPLPLMKSPSQMTTNFMKFCQKRTDLSCQCTLQADSTPTCPSQSTHTLDPCLTTLITPISFSRTTRRTAHLSTSSESEIFELKSIH